MKAPKCDVKAKYFCFRFQNTMAFPIIKILTIIVYNFQATRHRLPMNSTNMLTSKNLLYFQGDSQLDFIHKLTTLKKRQDCSIIMDHNWWEQFFFLVTGASLAPFNWGLVQLLSGCFTWIILLLAQFLSFPQSW